MKTATFHKMHSIDHLIKMTTLKKQKRSNPIPQKEIFRNQIQLMRSFRIKIKKFQQHQQLAKTKVMVKLMKKE